MSASNPRMDASPTCARSGVNPLPLLENLEQRLLLTTVSLALSTTEITEIGGVPAVFTVNRDNTVGDLTVKYRVGGSEPAGKIAETLSGTLVIPNGASSATISATPMNDGAAGNNNTLTIQLLDPDGNGYSLGTVSQGTVRIDESTSLLGTYITVGPGKMYADPWTAIRNASAGVTIDVWPSASGQYTMPTGDSSLGKVNYSNVTIRGIGEGRVKMFSNPATQLANQKGIIIFQGGQTNFTMENLDLEGARYGTPGYGNGAGLRGQGDNYTVRNCLFANNEDGILSDGSGASNILIEYSEFNNNGAGDGQSHNLYIGTGANVLTFQYNHDIGANEGHLLKSRAKTSYVLYNFFQGGLTESYELSMPDSGKAYVIGNVIRQAPTTHNSIIFDYASETAPRVGDFLYVVGNTIINSAGGGTFIQGTKMAAGFGVTIKDNILAGPGTPWSLGGATPTTAGNVINGSIAALNFVNYAAYDYHLLSTSPAIGAGVAPGSSSDGYSLAPTQEYVRENGVKSRPTGSPYDAGAYDYLSDTTAPTVTNVAVNDALLSDGDVGNGKFTVTLTYSEAMGSSPAPTITFTPAVASSLSFASGSWTDTTHYAAVYNVADANVAVASIGIGVTGGQDSAGNTQTAYSGSNNFGIDTLNPAAPIITGITTDTGVSSTDGITSDQTLSISGTAEANSTVTVTRGGTGVIGTAAANGSGAWSFDYTGTSLVQGSYNFTAKATDVSGNVSGISATYAVVVDLTAPTSSASVDHVAITLAAADTGGSSVRSIQYQVNGGAWTTYASPFSVLAGDSVNYYAQDVAGNAETPHLLTVPLVAGDANRDGYVDVVDLGILAMHYDTAMGATWSMGDFNGDGAVDVIDLGKLARNYDYDTNTPTAMPNVDQALFYAWLDSKAAHMLAACPIVRTNLVYVDVTAADDNGTGAIDSPVKTLEHAVVRATANGGDTTIYLKRGQVIPAAYGVAQKPGAYVLPLDVPRVSVATYGTITDPKPIINGFTHPIAANAAAWTAGTGGEAGTYKTTVTPGVAWLVDASGSDTRWTNVLSKQTSAANCAATNNSWALVGTTLYVRAGANVNPNLRAWEYSLVSEAGSVYGWSMGQDGMRPDNVVLLGYGLGEASGSFYGILALNAQAAAPASILVTGTGTIGGVSVNGIYSPSGVTLAGVPVYKHPSQAFYISRDAFNAGTWYISDAAAGEGGSNGWYAELSPSRVSGTWHFLGGTAAGAPVSIATYSQVVQAVTNCEVYFSGWHNYEVIPSGSFGGASGVYIANCKGGLATDIYSGGTGAGCYGAYQSAAAQGGLAYYRSCESSYGKLPTGLAAGGKLTGVQGMTWHMHGETGHVFAGVILQDMTIGTTGTTTAAANWYGGQFGGVPGIAGQSETYRSFVVDTDTTVETTAAVDAQKTWRVWEGA